MGTACDMDKPIGYWVQQTRSGGETIAVKVLYPSPHEQGASAGDPAREVPAKPEKTA
jgi:hypothetical protein